jgi:hypothetical protein
MAAEATPAGKPACNTSTTSSSVILSAPSSLHSTTNLPYRAFLVRLDFFTLEFTTVDVIAALFIGMRSAC